MVLENVYIAIVCIRDLDKFNLSMTVWFKAQAN